MPTTLLRRLDQVAVVHRGRRARRSQHELVIFTDEELEELCVLARKADAAKRLGQPVAWTAEEQIVLYRLEAKRAMTQ